MIHIQEVKNPEELEQAFVIRKKVFVEEQNVSLEEEYDEFEKECLHILAYFKGIPTGTARMRFTKEGIKLERFSVLKEYRGSGVGTALVKKLLTECKNKNKSKVYLYAQVSAVQFYEKFHFEKEGDIFLDAGIDHIKMQYNEKRKTN
ncbi:MAG: GNAT family N-acetyltransferase [Leptospiraceae bacterium]|nr:GNAT family N-acetyltransferase [Leptospiraceae bacterium]